MSEVVSIRFNDSEFMDILIKTADRDGKQIMSPGQFCKQACLTNNVKIFNHEVEEYKVFILSKISHNINQITYRLNRDNEEKRINEETYVDNLIALEKVLKEINQLTKPLR